MARTSLATRNGLMAYYPLLGGLNDSLGGTPATLTRATNKLKWNAVTHKFEQVSNNTPVYLPAYDGAISIEKQRTNLFLNNKFDDSNPPSGLTTEDSTLTISRSNDWSCFSGSNYSAKLVCSSADKVAYQEIMLTAASYHITAYAYIDGVTAVDSSVLSLYCATDLVSSVLPTTFTALGGGVYELQGQLTGTNASYSVGVKVKANKTVYLHLADCHALDSTIKKALSPIPTEGSSATVNFDLLKIADITGQLSNSGTLSFWFLPYFTGGAGSFSNDIYEWLQIGTGAYRLHLDTYSNGFLIEDELASVKTATSNHTACVWQFHVLEWEGNVIRYYIDDSLIVNWNSRTRHAVLNITNPKDFLLGSGVYGWSRSSVCGICNVMLWNKSLTSIEKTALRNSGRVELSTDKLLSVLTRNTTAGRTAVSGRSVV